MSTQAKVFEIVELHTGSIPKSTEDTLDSLGIDSLDKVEIIMDLEDEFGIEISDDEVEELVAVQDLIDLVDSKSPLPAA